MNIPSGIVSNTFNKVCSIVEDEQDDFVFLTTEKWLIILLTEIDKYNI